MDLRVTGVPKVNSASFVHTPPSHRHNLPPPEQFTFCNPAWDRCSNTFINNKEKECGQLKSRKDCRSVGGCRRHMCYQLGQTLDSTAEPRRADCSGASADKGLEVVWSNLQTSTIHLHLSNDDLFRFLDTEE